MKRVVGNSLTWPFVMTSAFLADASPYCGGGTDIPGNPDGISLSVTVERRIAGREHAHGPHFVMQSFVLWFN